MPAAGGPAQRLTYLGHSSCRPVAWRDNEHIIFTNGTGQPFAGMMHLHSIHQAGGAPERLNIGPARAISYGEKGGVVIGRNNRDPARWKRYRGGTSGQIWIDELGDGQFRPLLDIEGNLDSPLWVSDRIFFLSDHEGVGNLYSCLPSGEGLRRHSDHTDYYARDATKNGRFIVYHSGANIYRYDVEKGSSSQVDITFHSSQTQRNRKFVSAQRYLQSWGLHPEGHSAAITSRGKPYTFANWEGAITQLGQANGTRYRLLTWLNDGQRLIAVTDAGGEEKFVIFQPDNNGAMKSDLLEGLDIGRPLALRINPKKDQILFSNHRYELLALDLESRELTVIDRGKAARIGGFDWSPDGEWAVYSISIALKTTILKLWQAATNETTPLTKPLLLDVNPVFDPKGKFIYFISYREFDPVRDNLQFDLNFPRGARPYLIPLQRDQTSPFISEPRAPGQKNGDNNSKKDKPAAEKAGQNGETTPNEGEKSAETKKGVHIDLDGITERLIAFPVDEGRYGRILGSKDGKVLYARYPVEGALNQPRRSPAPPAKGVLFAYDFEEQKEEQLLHGITSFDLSRDGATLIVRAGNRLRVLKAGKGPDNHSDDAGRKSGWLDLSRVKVSIIPGQEWRQMVREAWRLQRDHFWTADMSQVDWLKVYERYLPLVDRIASRAEFSDLMWEMQGELGTSHCYEMGGDYRTPPRYAQGHLGADFVYDNETESWRITHIARGDVWDDKSDSPLNKPGINVGVGDRLLAINGRILSQTFSPAMALVNLAGEDVTLTVAAKQDSENEEAKPQTRNILVNVLRDETPARYREWVEQNRQRVHAATNGRVGYVHIPDMGVRGYAEFHRGYLAEVGREGLIVDVRYNGGGNVSALILEKLARRRVGYDVSRWAEIPYPYPDESILGPMVALTNEHAGSDGDIFSHSFKLMGLGPLIGKRTWGGVIGIYPRHSLVDGTTTTQPEFSFWFPDVGWGVENYGTDPDIEIDNTPQDYAAQVDAQLERAITEIERLFQENPPQLPAFDQRPNLALPTLPPRQT